MGNGLFDQMGGREWARGIDAALEVPTTDKEVRLVLPDGTGPNRVTVVWKRKGEVKLTFGRVDGDDGEDMGTFTERDGAGAARLIGELVAESLRRARVRVVEPEPVIA